MQLRRWTMLPGAAVCAGVARGPRPGQAADVDKAPGGHGDGWPVARPSKAGFDPAQLAALSDRVQAGEIPNVHSVLVEHDGRLVLEKYFPGSDESWGQSRRGVDHGPETLHDLRSVTKSVTSALVGIALGADHATAVHQPIASFFPDLADKIGGGMAQVSLNHVLTMTAGLEWNEMEVPYTDPSNDEIQLYRTDDPVGMVLARSVVPPGNSWSYNGGLTQVAPGVIERLTGKPIDRFAEDVLFGPLDISDYEWPRSSAWSESTSPGAASGLRLRARDLGKIASLFLHGGAWREQQIVPSGWITASTRRLVQDIPWGPPGVYG